MANEFRDPRSRSFEILTSLFGLIWLLNAVFQARAWIFMPRSEASANLLHTFTKPVANAPIWLKPALLGMLHGVQTIGPNAVAFVMVVIAMLLGLALLARTALSAACWLGIFYCLVCWLTLNALGFPYTHGQTDPGVFVPYAITFVFVVSVQPFLDRSKNDTVQLPNRLWNGAQILFGLLWAFDAGLKWLPAFLFHFMSQVTSAIHGQPYWVTIWLGFVVAVIGIIGPVTVAVIVAAAETVIAIGLLTGRGLGIILPFGVLYSLAVWSTAETFGGPYTAAGTGVRGNVLGNVIIYVVPLFFLWVEQRGYGLRMAHAARSRTI
jgi:hypothetical protein